MFPKMLKYLFEILLNLFVSNTNHFYPQLINDLCSQRVMILLSLVHLAVDLYDQLLFMAIKVSYEKSSSAIYRKSDRMLS